MVCYPLTYFVILDCEIDREIPIILVSPLLATKITLVDMEYGKIKFWVNNEEVSFSICETIKKLLRLEVVSVIGVVDEKVTNVMEVGLG